MSRPKCCLLVLLSLVIALIAAPGATAAPGDLDPSFGSGGMVKLLEGHEDSYGEAVVVQPDGKIVLAGYEKGNAVVLRLLPDGAPDPTFGSGGKVTTVVPGGSSGARAVALQPDGKIVVAGGAEGASNFDFFFARYNSDGSPDMSFGGGDGIELVPVGAESDEAEAVTIGPAGRVAATGFAELPGNGEALAAVVLKANGEPDPSFGGDGSVTKETSGHFDTGVAVAMFGDGGVLVGDSAGAGAGGGFVLMKLLANGEYDPAFGGGDGVVVTPVPIEGAVTDIGRITDFVLLPDGRIVAAGYGYDYEGSPPEYLTKVAVIRYLADGELDPSFADGGIFTRRIGTEGTTDTVVLGEKGRILIAGYYRLPVSGTTAAWVGRLDAGGTPDPGFGAGGFVLRSDTAPFGEGIEDAALDSEDRLVTVGTAYAGENTSWASLSRYLGDPRPPKAVPISAPANQPAHAKMKPVPKKVRAEKLHGFFGSAADPDGNGVRSVQIALVKKVRGGSQAKASAGARLRCFALKNAKAGFRSGFQQVRPQGGQCPQRWITVKGTAKWGFKLKGKLPPGKYVVYARATDGKGLAETTFSRKLGNRYAFRVLPPRRSGSQFEAKSSRPR
jgi:uncharacterized delta-60 repeat protein